jgi:hypothetical protein
MRIQLQQELAEKERALAKLQAVVQENWEVMPPSVATTLSNTMTKTTLVILPSLDFSHDNFGEFEKHTRGNGSKILKSLSKHLFSLIPICNIPDHQQVGACYLRQSSFVEIFTYKLNRK